MPPERGPAPSLQQLSSLEVEPLEIVVNAPESEQDSSLDTLTTVLGDIEVATLLTDRSTFPVNANCCCCCISCCCCC